MKTRIPAILLILLLPTAVLASTSTIKTVFVIAEENHDWASYKGNINAPYINNTLLPAFAHAEHYMQAGDTHPSAPNYVWMEAGGAIAGAGDELPANAGSNTPDHLSAYLTKAGVSWREYAEPDSSWDGTTCLLNYSPVDVNHVPFSYFADDTDNYVSNSPTCLAHEKPFSQLQTDLNNNTVARYNFITPNLNDDNHDGTIAQMDSWLAKVVPMIMNSQAYKDNGVIFIVEDESAGSVVPIMMIAVSPLAKPGYSGNVTYTNGHSSLLRSLQEVFGVVPPNYSFIRDAANATDLSDLFASGSLSGSGDTTPPAPPKNLQVLP